MPCRPIVVYPDPRLKQVCTAVTAIDDGVRQLAADLRDTLNSVVGTGIAAPQIGDLRRVVYIDASRNPKYADDCLGPLTLINPVITACSGSRRFREGCLSLPQYTATVKRAKRIAVTALDLTGTALHLEVNGFEAVLLQHELDHLDGVLFIDRVEDLTSLLMRREGPDDA